MMLIPFKWSRMDDLFVSEACIAISCLTCHFQTTVVLSMRTTSLHIVTHADG